MDFIWNMLRVEEGKINYRDTREKAWRSVRRHFHSPLRAEGDRRGGHDEK